MDTFRKDMALAYGDDDPYGSASASSVAVHAIRLNSVAVAYMQALNQQIAQGPSGLIPRTWNIARIYGMNRPFGGGAAAPKLALRMVFATEFALSQAVTAEEKGPGYGQQQYIASRTSLDSTWQFLKDISCSSPKLAAKPSPAPPTKLRPPGVSIIPSPATFSLGPEDFPWWPGATVWVQQDENNNQFAAHSVSHLNGNALHRVSGWYEQIELHRELMSPRLEILVSEFGSQQVAHNGFLAVLARLKGADKPNSYPHLGWQAAEETSSSVYSFQDLAHHERIDGTSLYVWYKNFTFEVLIYESHAPSVSFLQTYRNAAEGSVRKLMGFSDSALNGQSRNRPSPQGSRLYLTLWASPSVMQYDNPARIIGHTVPEAQCHLDVTYSTNESPISLDSRDAPADRLGTVYWYWRQKTKGNSGTAHASCISKGEAVTADTYFVVRH